MTSDTFIVSTLPGPHFCGGEECPGLAWPASEELPHPRTCLAAWERPAWPGPAARVRVAPIMRLEELADAMLANTRAALETANRLNVDAGRAVFRRRVAAGLTRQQAATAIGIAVLDLARVEAGRHVDTAIRAAVRRWVESL